MPETWETRTVSVTIAGFEVWPPSWLCVVAVLGLLTLLVATALMLILNSGKNVGRD